ncbi:hypothetical protein KY290_030953 [Solanum tuberosum]|uniref:Uncharacterized protein n=1 Tax=Solanum tuberosum TaxID=4113 RepID=A0ABQ7U7S1_SOLTU|nr:hypothetical protein KY290_030953 [Solanum tuberosum]
MLQSLHNRIHAFTLQQPRQTEALHCKLYTAGYRLLHYNSPASRRLYITSFTQPDTVFYITTAPPAGGLTLQALHSRIQALTLQQPRQSESLPYKFYTTGYMLLHYNNNPASRGPLHYKTMHYNEELPLSNKLGQVSAMSSITSYVKDSLSKLNSIFRSSDLNLTYNSLMSQFIITLHCGGLFENSSLYHKSLEVATKHFSFKFI